MAEIITVFNHKGGVGKTTTSLNLTAAIAKMGIHPLGIDLDPQAHFSLASGVIAPSPEKSLFGFFQNDTPLERLMYATEGGWTMIPSHMSLAKVDALHGANPKIAGKLKVGLKESHLYKQYPIIIDCCPTLGVLTLNAVLASDRILIPVSPDFLSLQGVERLEGALKVLEKNLNRSIPRRILVTRFDARRRLSYTIYDQIAERYGHLLCRTRISESVALAESPSFKRDIFRHAPHSPGAREYMSLALELVESGFFEIH
ncbi:MAG: ParA family protein [Pseudomonadota bacterium]